MGEQISDRSPSRWGDVRRNWKRLHGSSPWTEGNLPKAQNFLHAPYEIPWKLIPWMKFEPGSLTVRITPSRQDITPRWLLTMGLMKRLDASITIGESVIMNGEGRNQAIRSALLHFWITHQEINYGFPGMVMQACKLAMDARSNSETSSPIKWPGMQATTKQFDTSVNAVLNEEQDTGSTLVINGRLPSGSENAEKMRKWRFCAKDKTKNHRDFSVTTFFIELRKVVSTGKNVLNAWWEPKNSDWEKFARSVKNENSSRQIYTTEERIKNIRAWFYFHRGRKADEWLWSKAVEMQMCQDKQVRIPHSKAIPKHEGMQKGYVARYVPITRHLLPEITATGRIYEPKDAWTDNAMTTSSSHARTCERPGIYTIASLSDCNSHGVATDILGDGDLYMVVLEVQLPEDNKTEIQPTQKQCPGGVYYEEHCSISAMCIRRVGRQTSPGRICCSVGQGAKTLPIIGDDLWETPTIHTTTQIRMRERKLPVGPQGEGLVNKNLRKIMAKILEELALRPTTPLPRSDFNLPESDEDEADISEVGGFNPWYAQVNVVTAAAPFAPSKHESISCATEAAGAADASTRTTAALTTSRASTATTDKDWDTSNASGSFPTITESVAIGATRKRRGNMKGRGKGRFRKGDGKPDDWTEWIRENKRDELEALEKQHSARLGGKGQFHKGDGKPREWTAWEKEYQAAE
jgi:hypothetical protein